MRLVECVPNFSEGRDASVVARIVESVRSVEGVAVLGQTMDPDHHRSVITFAGTADVVMEAALRAVRTAAGLIDLKQHRGVHPRLGATDVLPFVPLGTTTLGECAELAWRVGERIWSEIGIPVYFYEAAARSPERVRLENIRRGGMKPDVGGPALHPTAGAVIAGARNFLVAWNVWLGTQDVAVAKRIARSIRESSGGFRCVKALGLELPSRGLTQVSMNLTDFEQTPLPLIYDEIRRLAEEAGATIARVELIGLIPERALQQTAGSALKFDNFNPECVVEERVEQLL